MAAVDRIEIRVDAEEKERIKERMKEAGIRNMSAYIRKMALNGYIIKLDMSSFDEVVRLMSINANNLNQYAKQANTNGSIYYGDIKNLQRQHQEIWQLLREILHGINSI